MENQYEFFVYRVVLKLNSDLYNVCIHLCPLDYGPIVT